MEKFGHRQIQSEDVGKDTGKALCEDGGRDYAVRAKERLGLSEAGRSLPYRFQRARGPANTLISDFQTPELGAVAVLCYSSPRK